MPQIIIEIGIDGAVRIEGQGFVGKACDGAMQAIENAVGLITDRKTKPEYFQREVTRDVLRTRA
jgi:hypothetical protein